MAVRKLTIPTVALPARPTRPGSMTRREALASMAAGAVAAGGPAVAQAVTGDTLVLVDGWLVKRSDIRPQIVHPLP